MKRLVAFFLLIFFFVVSFQQLTILGVFLLKQDFIVENFCINKEQPELQCNGKCHLNATMAKTSEENNNTQNVIEQVQIPFFYSEQNLFITIIQRKQEPFIERYQKLFPIYRANIFHPPQFA